MSVTEKLLQAIRKLECIGGYEVSIMGSKQALRQLPVDTFMYCPDNTYPVIWYGHKCIALNDNPNLRDDCIYLMPMPYKPLRVKITNENEDLR